MNAEEKVILNFDQAVDLLEPGEEVHVFLNPSEGMIIGADWSRREILELLKTATRIEVGGPECVRLKHGLVAWKFNRAHFIASERAK